MGEGYSHQTPFGQERRRGCTMRLPPACIQASGRMTARQAGCLHPTPRLWLKAGLGQSDGLLLPWRSAEMEKNSQPWKDRPFPPSGPRVCQACQEDNRESPDLEPAPAALSHLLSLRPPSGLGATLHLQAAPASPAPGSCYPTSCPFSFRPKRARKGHSHLPAWPLLHAETEAQRG